MQNPANVDIVDEPAMSDDFRDGLIVTVFTIGSGDQRGFKRSFEHVALGSGLLFDVFEQHEKFSSSKSSTSLTMTYDLSCS